MTVDEDAAVGDDNVDDEADDVDDEVTRFVLNSDQLFVFNS